MTDAPILEVRGLSKRFPVPGVGAPKAVHALTEATFSIHGGQVVALVGESGSGKSTTARLVSRLMPPSAGEILLDGRDVLKHHPHRTPLAYRRDVQMIFQDPFGSLNPVHDIAHHIERPIRVHRSSGAVKPRERVLELLELVGLSPAAEVARRYPHELSGGQRQRVSIARALAVVPRIILADEPISMLDVSIRMGVLNLITQLKEDLGLGFLYITHDLASARYVGDRTIVMYAGHMVEEAPSAELMDHPAHPYTRLLRSAVPDPQAGADRAELVRGEVPSLVNPPPGCPFAARCPLVKAECRASLPPRKTVATGHWVRCHAV